MLRQPYPSDLSPDQWHRLQPWLPLPQTWGRPRTVSLWDVVDAIRHVLCTGCAWQLLSHDFPCWQLVYGYFRTSCRVGLWACIHEALRSRVQRRAGRHATPSGTFLDSQSVPTLEVASPRGYVIGKKVKGRKRHLVVDTMGMLLAVVVHTADLQNRDGALIPARQSGRFLRLHVIWTEGGNLEPKLHTWLHQRANWADWDPEIPSRPTTASGFQVLPRCWVVERTFAWLGPVASQARCLSQDYEGFLETSETWIQIAMTDRMLHCLKSA